MNDSARVGAYVSKAAGQGCHAVLQNRRGHERFSSVSWLAVQPLGPERIGPCRRLRSSRLEAPTLLPHATGQANGMVLSKPAVRPPLRPASVIPSTPKIRESAFRRPSLPRCDVVFAEPLAL